MGIKELMDELDRPPQIVLRPIADIVEEKRTVQWLIPKTIEAGVLAVIVGRRATFKSFIALDWTMQVARDGKPAVMLSGEGAGLDRRVDAWMRSHCPDTPIRSLPVLALEQALNLNSKETLANLVEAIDRAAIKPALICIDTLSKYSAGLDENSNAEVAMFLGDLGANLRDRYQATVLLVAHTGHGDGKRPRGAYALMANPDSEFIVERIEGTMTTTVSRERYKDAPSMPPLVYGVFPVDLDRADELGDRVTSLIVRPSDNPPPQVKRTGRNQEKALVALREWCRTNPKATHITSEEFKAILNTQKVSRQRWKEVLNYLVNVRILTASVAGYTIDTNMM